LKKFAEIYSNHISCSRRKNSGGLFFEKKGDFELELIKKRDIVKKILLRGFFVL
jgi:hypothetical protein